MGYGSGRGDAAGGAMAAVGFVTDDGNDRAGTVAPPGQDVGVLEGAGPAAGGAAALLRARLALRVLQDAGWRGRGRGRRQDRTADAARDGGCQAGPGRAAAALVLFDVACAYRVFSPLI